MKWKNFRGWYGVMKSEVGGNGMRLNDGLTYKNMKWDEMEWWDEMKGIKLNRKIVIERNEMDSQVWNEGTMG